jgi:hypothetical protein
MTPPAGFKPGLVEAVFKGGCSIGHHVVPADAAFETIVTGEGVALNPRTTEVPARAIAELSAPSA